MDTFLLKELNLQSHTVMIGQGIVFLDVIRILISTCSTISLFSNLLDKEKEPIVHQLATELKALNLKSNIQIITHSCDIATKQGYDQLQKVLDTHPDLLIYCGENERRIKNINDRCAKYLIPWIISNRYDVKSPRLIKPGQTGCYFCTPVTLSKQKCQVAKQIYLVVQKVQQFYLDLSSKQQEMPNKKCSEHYCGQAQIEINKKKIDQITIQGQVIDQQQTIGQQIHKPELDLEDINQPVADNVQLN